jgi:hypothetical protein
MIPLLECQSFERPGNMPCKCAYYRSLLQNHAWHQSSHRLLSLQTATKLDLVAIFPIHTTKHIVLRFHKINVRLRFAKNSYYVGRIWEFLANHNRAFILWNLSTTRFVSSQVNGYDPLLCSFRGADRNPWRFVVWIGKYCDWAKFCCSLQRNTDLSYLEQNSGRWKMPSKVGNIALMP